MAADLPDISPGELPGNLTGGGTCEYRHQKHQPARVLYQAQQRPQQPPTVPPTGTAMVNCPTSTPRKHQMHCMILIPAAPPRSTQKTIMSVGAKIGGIGEVDSVSSGTAGWVSDMKELPSSKLLRQGNFRQLPTHAGRQGLLPALFLAKGCSQRSSQPARTRSISSLCRVSSATWFSRLTLRPMSPKASACRSRSS